MLVMIYMKGIWIMMVSPKLAHTIYVKHLKKQQHIFLNSELWESV